ncbi:hypothetical protein J4E91_003282 [Alternaria rosae]|nr:hypothetical protein J4E91_003282 [Alternaria rosae]
MDDTTPLLGSERSYRSEEAGGDFPRTTDGHDASTTTSSTTPRPVTPVVAELLIIPSLSLPTATHSLGSIRSVLQSFKLSKLHLNRFLPPPEASCHIEGPENEHSIAQMESEVQYDGKSLISEILSPLLDDLKELKALTQESLQDYNQNLNNETHAQVLKQKLLPIGQLIVYCLETVPLNRRAICHHIADNYWPLPVNFFTHLKIQEKYRNALFKLAQRTPAGTMGPHPEKDSEQPRASAIEPDPPYSSLDPKDHSDTPIFPRLAAEQPKSLVIQAAPGSGDFLDLDLYELSAEAVEQANARNLDSA